MPRSFTAGDNLSPIDALICGAFKLLLDPYPSYQDLC